MQISQVVFFLFSLRVVIFEKIFSVNAISTGELWIVLHIHFPVECWSYFMEFCWLVLHFAPLFVTQICAFVLALLCYTLNTTLRAKPRRQHTRIASSYFSFCFCLKSQLLIALLWFFSIAFNVAYTGRTGFSRVYF